MKTNYNEKSKIKIIFYVGTALTTGRGYENTLLNFCKYLDKSKFNITLIETDYSPQKRIDDKYINSFLEGVNRIKLKGYKDLPFEGLYSKFSKIPLWAIWRPLFLSPFINLIIRKKFSIDAIVKELKPDIIYFVDNNDSSIFKKSKATYIGSNQGMFENINSIYYKILIKLVATNVLFNRIKFFHLFPINSNLPKILKNKICKIIPSGIQVVDYKALSDNRDKNKVKIIYLASLDKWKGILLAIDAFLSLPFSENLEFHIGGDGPLRSFVEKTVKINKNIKYYGIIKTDSLSEFYQQGDIFLYPSMGETFGLVVLEAVYHGLFVLAGKNLKGNFDDIEKKGFLEYCNYDKNEITVSLQNAISNITNLRGMKTEMKNYVSENYGWENIVKELSNLIINANNK